MVVFSSILNNGILSLFDCLGRQCLCIQCVSSCLNACRDIIIKETFTE